ncbi:MAG: tetratricopeptide repeat protein [Acidobacteria bacterium]|nr:tetratricopeptide repeat protein [Acidobacteriota bacterium]
MEFFYNLDSMREEEIKETFVGRQGLLDELVELIRRQPDGAGVQHAVILAPRGMGKTTMLLMLQFAARDGELKENWQPVRFPEESYGINDLADFWIESLTILAADTNDEELRKQTEQLEVEYSNSDELQEIGLAALKDWRNKHGKRLLLLVDNFDMILEQINDERDNARLRDVLMNDGTLMLIGGTVSFFREARAYDQPLYNFFKIFELKHLTFDQMLELLRRRAEVDQIENFEEKLKANLTRLRVLEYFAAGNPRLVLMLYRVVTQSDLTEVRLALEKLLDEVTPYFKAKIESLPPQQRKILDYIARISSKTNEGLTPTEIATHTRLSPNQVSAQLKRLSELGYVRSANLSGRSSFYTLSEPLYAIWHQMRFGRDARQKMQWLVNFLKSWFSPEEIKVESQKLAERFLEFIQLNHLSKASNTLDYRQLVAEAMEDEEEKIKVTERINQDIQKYVEVAKTTLSKVKKMKLLFNESQNALANGQPLEALQKLEEVSKIDPRGESTWILKGRILQELGQLEEAGANFDQALTINPNNCDTLLDSGLIQLKQGNFEQAINSFDKLLRITPNDTLALCARGLAQILYAIHSIEFEKISDSIKFIKQALKLDPEDELAKGELAIAYWGLFSWEVIKGNFESAEQNWKLGLDNFNDLSGKLKQALLNLVSFTFNQLVEWEQINFARRLISESPLEDQFFPLVRAIDYLKTGDEALIEKLSPEVRQIVEQVVETLRPLVPEALNRNVAKPVRKATAGPRHRSRKQLDKT